MIPLTKEEKKIHNKQKVCYICKKRFSTMITVTNIIRLETIVILMENTEVLLTIYAI